VADVAAAAGAGVSGVAENTDRELFREDNGDPAGSYYEPHVFVTKDGQIGMGVGGTVWTATIREWHELMNSDGAKYLEALREIDAMEPDDFKTGQGHVSPAFREVNFRDAFKHVVRIVNRVLHNTDENGRAL
jgi:hypothetical protein